MSGHHAQRDIIVSTFIPGCQDTHSDIVILVCLIGSVIHSLVETEGITSVEGRIAVLLFRKDILIDHLGNLIDNLGHLNILAVDLTVDFLLFVCQEDIMRTVLLHQHLTHQDLERFFNMLFHVNAVIIDVLNHETGDVVDVGLDLQNILDHEQGLQYVDSEDITVLMLRIDVCIIVGSDDYTFMAVVQEVFQCVIETVEGYNRTDFFIFYIHGRLFEQSQHGSLSFGQMLTGCTVGTNGSQYACQKIELIRDERIHFRKIPAICI